MRGVRETRLLQGCGMEASGGEEGFGLILDAKMLFKIKISFFKACCMTEIYPIVLSGLIFFRFLRSKAS